MKTIAPFAGRLAALITTVTVLGVAGSPGAAATPAPIGLQHCAGNGTALVACSFDVPPGTYQVALLLRQRPAVPITVTAEARRTMLASATPGLRPQIFAVDVREPEGEPTGQGGAGTPGLQIRIGSVDGSPLTLGAVLVRPLPQARTLFLAGDSTVCDQTSPPYTGWGQQLPQYFDERLVVANYADSGESSGSFLTNEALMPSMEKRIRPGDYVMVQFGHNDKTSTAADFRRNLGEILDRIVGRGGRPILVTPPVRQLFGPDGKLNATALHVNSLGVDLPAEMRPLAVERAVPLIDLTDRSRQLVESLGPTASSALYLPEKKDRTHNSEYGADQFAQLVLAGLGEVPYGPNSYRRSA